MNIPTPLTAGVRGPPGEDRPFHWNLRSGAYCSGKTVKVIPLASPPGANRLLKNPSPIPSRARENQIVVLKPLHTTYSNLGSWRRIDDPTSGMVRIEFNQKGGIVISILLFIFCAIGAMWLAKFRSDAGNEGARVAGVWIVSITGVVVPLVILAYGASERRKGDLMRYFPDDDVLEFPRMVRSIENAKQRRVFFLGALHESGGTLL